MQVRTEDHAPAVPGVLRGFWDAERRLRVLYDAGHHTDPHWGGPEWPVPDCPAFGWVWGAVAVRGAPGKQWVGRDLDTRFGRNRGLEIAACAISLLQGSQNLQFAVSLINI